MLDQAKRLRELMRQRIPTGSQTPHQQGDEFSALVIAVASGKGGVGKSNFSTNLAMQLRKAGKRVTIIDADFGLANVEILMGLHPKSNVLDVLNGKSDMLSALTEGPLGCKLLSGGAGISSLTDAELTDGQLLRLIEGFAQLNTIADIIIVDTRAGLSNSVLNFIKAASDTIVVTTPDPTAIADAYALIKSVKSTMPECEQLKLVVNNTVTKQEGTDVYDKLNGVCKRFLGVRMVLLGCIPYDPHLVKAVRRQQPVSLLYPHAESTQRFAEIASKLLEVDVQKPSSIQNFVLKLIGRFGA